MANTSTDEIETRIRRDNGGWMIEARIPVAKNVYQWRIQGWTSGTKRDALRSEREIRADLLKTGAGQ